MSAILNDRRDGDGKTSIAVGNENGLVLMIFPEPKKWVGLEPSNARQVAETLARNAYRVEYGAWPPDGVSVVSSEIRSRVTEQIRQRMINRLSIMLASMTRDGRKPEHMVREMVDRVLQEVA